MKQISFLFLFVLAVSIPFSCTEPTLIGSELLEEDQANLNFRKDLTVEAKTVLGTPIPTHNVSLTFQLSRFLIGQLEDPVFGKSTASLYTQVARGTDSLYLSSAVTIDSVILSVAFDESASYGDLSQPFEVEVLRLQEDLDDEVEYFSDEVFQTDPVPIGQGVFTPNFDSVAIVQYTEDGAETVIERAHVRIPLNKEFGESLLSDASIYESEEAFAAAFKGLLIRPTKTTEGLLALNFINSISRITTYYTTVFGEQKREYRYPFQFGNARFSNFLHEIEGTSSAQNLDKNDTDLLYLQGMQGYNVEVSFPDITELGDVVVNKAELELTIASQDTANMVDQLIASYVVDGERIIINDVRYAIIGQNPLNTEVFGGVPVEEEVNGMIVTKYKLNVSAHLQDILDGNAENTITISSGVEDNLYFSRIISKAELASNVILFGTNHPEFAPKLSVTFTSL